MAETPAPEVKAAEPVTKVAVTPEDKEGDGLAGLFETLGMADTSVLP